ncbi:MAG: hypothetical protein V1821_03300 [bacterium]
MLTPIDQDKFRRRSSAVCETPEGDGKVLDLFSEAALAKRLKKELKRVSRAALIQYFGCLYFLELPPVCLEATFELLARSGQEFLVRGAGPEGLLTALGKSHRGSGIIIDVAPLFCRTVVERLMVSAEPLELVVFLAPGSSVVIPSLDRKIVR